MAIRVSILIKRKEGMSVEEFNEYWSVSQTSSPEWPDLHPYVRLDRSTNHGRLFTSVKAVQTNMIRYSQVRAPSGVSLRDSYSASRIIFQFHVLPAPSAALAAAGMPIAQFDGAAEFWVEKMEDLLAVFSDEEYKTVSKAALFAKAARLTLTLESHS